MHGLRAKIRNANDLIRFRSIIHEIFIRSLRERIKIQRRIYIIAIRCAPAKFAKRSWQMMRYTYHQYNKPQANRRAPKAQGKDL